MSAGIFTARSSASRLRPGWALFASFVFGAVGAASAASLPSGFSESVVASGLAAPTAMQVAPDGRIFICEKPGRLRVVKNGALLSSPFLTVTTSTSGERGLLGVAFDPNFASNRYVYVYYTSTSGSIHNRVSRFTASSSNPDVAQSGSEFVLLDLPSVGSAIYHNGGAIHFGSDGKLYIAVGDHKQNSASPSLSSVFGKILRINVDAPNSFPTDNPFYSSTTGINRAIWARGLRNPYNFAFERVTNDMLVNDVGEGTWEEINEGIAGANYGWPSTEGNTSNPSFVSPLYVYESNGGPCAIVGGDFYDPVTPMFPSSYNGRYFFGDYCAGWMRTYNPDTDSASGFATGINGLVDTKVHFDGSLYYVQLGSGGPTGTTGALYRVIYGTGAQPPSITQHPQSQTVVAGQSVTFNVSVSGTSPFTYQWQRNSSNISGATGASYTRTAAASDNGSTYRVIVTNSAGSATSNAATLTVTSGSPPVATINSPAVGTTYGGGTTINFSGSATDAEDGALPASRFTWWIVQHHDDHTHSAMDPTSGITSGSFTVPAVNETSDNVYLVIHLRVTDSSGLTHEVTRQLLPRKTQVTLASSPSGLQLTLDGIPVTTPHTFTGVEGVIRTLGATSPQNSGGQTYSFTSWSDGGNQTHDISTPVNDTTYTATFTAGAVTTLTWETESLTRTSTGASTALQSDSNTSGGTWVALQADGVGDYVEYTLPSVPAGTYSLRMRYKGHPNRGILAASVAGQQIGATLDQYSGPSIYPEHTFGNVTFASSGNQIVRLTVTGRNAASGAYTLSSDTFTLVSTSPPPPQVAAPTFSPVGGTYASAQSVTISSSTSGASIRYTTNGSTPTSSSGTVYSSPVSISSTTTLRAIAYHSGMTDSNVSSATYTIGGSSGPIEHEAEAVARTSSGASTATQSDSQTSGGVWIALQADGTGDYVEYTLPNIPAGAYSLRMRYKGHPNRGVLALSVGGQQIGGTLDQYSSTSVYPEHTFGNVTFASSGNQIVRLTVTGRNAASGAFTLSSDKFTLVPDGGGGQQPAKFSVAGSAVTASGNDGNVPANTVDGNLGTRWSANGDGQWIRFDLGAVRTLSLVKVAFYNGDQRTSTFDIQTSNDGASWTTIGSRTSSGNSLQLETFDFTDVSGRYVRLLGHGNSVNLWNSYTEVEVWGF